MLNGPAVEIRGNGRGPACADLALFGQACEAAATNPGIASAAEHRPAISDRDEAAFRGSALARETYDRFGVSHKVVDKSQITEFEPGLTGEFHRDLWPDGSLSVEGSGAVNKTYARLFADRSGELIQTEAVALEAQADKRWQLTTSYSWVTGDEVYGGDWRLRVWLESREQPFVLAVARNEPLWWQGSEYASAQAIAQALSPRSWKRLSAGPGAKGEPVRLGTRAAMAAAIDPEE